MSEPQDGYDLLNSPPSNADLSGELKARKSQGVPKATLGLLGVVLLVGGFVGGLAVGKNSSSSKSSPAATSTARGGRGGAGGTGGFGGRTGGGFVSGTVTGVNGTTLTITDSTGKTRTVDTSSDTTVTIAKTGALGDLATGDQVTVTGTANSDGSVTARSIVSGLTGFGFGGRGGSRGPGAPGATPTTPAG